MDFVLTSNVSVLAEMPSESGSISIPNVPVLSSHPYKDRSAKSNTPKYFTFIILRLEINLFLFSSPNLIVEVVAGICEVFRRLIA